MNTRSKIPGTVTHPGGLPNLARSAGQLILATVLLAALPVLESAADCNPAFTKINPDGFGTDRNHYIWALKSFEGYLHASTYNPDEGGEIWRWDGVTWERTVVGGLTTTNSAGARNLVIFNGDLYGGVFNTTDGAELWRTTDGATWSAVVTGGFGDPENISVRGMTVFQDQLYIGLQTEFGGRGKIYRSADGVNFTAVITDGFGTFASESVHAFAEYKGDLYAGVKNTIRGLEIWRSSDGTDWEPVVGPGAATPRGFGNVLNSQVYDLEVFNGRMYVGLANNQGHEVWRTDNGVTYELALSGGRFDNWSWRFGVYQNKLWLGEFNTLTLYLQQPVAGGQVRVSADGTNWDTYVGRNGLFAPRGFGTGANWGIRSFEAYQPPGATEPYWYVGTGNCWNECGGNGGEIWEWPGESCP